jgi:CheY-like chemotaxis protein
MPRTVLIVDDDLPTQKLLEAVMRRNGLDAVIAPSGREAIEIVDSRDDLACIILDLMMPTIDGPAVVAHLAAKGHDIPVIVCTAVGPRHTPEFDPSLVRAVVRKPFDIEELIRIVNTVSRRE